MASVVDLDPNKNVWEEISDGQDIIKLGDAEVNSRAYCSSFNFKGGDQQKKVSLLSGGERNRVHMAKLLREGGNVLLLDEPTNDFDIDTLIALEEYLDHFAGCLIVVSHDRYFLDRTVDHVFRFEPNGKIRMYPGNYSAFMEIKAREEAAVEKAKVKTQKAKEPAGKQKKDTGSKKLSYNEKRELEQLEVAIVEAEDRKVEIENELAANATNFDLVSNLYLELEKLTQKLDTDVDRWSELAERE